MRTIVIGDIHGCLDELKELLALAQLEKSDRVILVGDLVNKGPKSLETLEFAKESDFEVVIGNHELKLIEILENPEKHSSNESSLTQLSQKITQAETDWLSWLKSLPSHIEEEDFLVVHGGLAPNTHPKDTSIHVLANIRTWDGTGADMNNTNNPAWHELYTGRKLVIYGHWAVQGLHVKENSIGLDSGCCYGGKLSAVILPERKIIQVDAKKAYQNFKA